jgi:hypothetical protein
MNSVVFQADTNAVDAVASSTISSLLTNDRTPQGDMIDDLNHEGTIQERVSAYSENEIEPQTIDCGNGFISISTGCTM